MTPGRLITGQARNWREKKKMGDHILKKKYIYIKKKKCRTVTSSGKAQKTKAIRDMKRGNARLKGGPLEPYIKNPGRIRSRPKCSKPVICARIPISKCRDSKTDLRCQIFVIHGETTRRRQG
ncbi:hypothetical protein CEXT_683961 [Caerostris extrusa]|uniref:Uncharacterized protein n=1 Tax=Caerostris extrusa TaxID=172846 RepID=A0AAV4VND3_CAEEX|nr:hypothetical protein CEXT_683961 [Caerostris extrusa]